MPTPRKPKAKRASTPTLPSYLKEDSDATKVFRQTVKYLKEAGDLNKVDTEAIAAYSKAASEVKRFDEFLYDRGYTTIDKNGSERRRPQVIMRKDASDRLIQYAKMLGIDRHFREKGREKATSLGKPMDKFARLRKVG
ncbi:P27 family phage terminase small subunit [Neolewinella antarctica]|uniref:P27 family predicted phage terminase small subunit n=1 Tax=Neolewinella antarctica TaxID=442734 RepID=A0ABX0X6D8_9BACT|nr:P27 family phage terminase small subunit [Neolewinella antarctica]NJC24789.1 P27 family predicted phage terminase small subunit [Neolewinella antarctica]